MIEKVTKELAKHQEVLSELQQEQRCLVRMSNITGYRYTHITTRIKEEFNVIRKLRKKLDIIKELERDSNDNR